MLNIVLELLNTLVYKSSELFLHDAQTPQKDTSLHSITHPLSTSIISAEESPNTKVILVTNTDTVLVHGERHTNILSMLLDAGQSPE